MYMHFMYNDFLFTDTVLLIIIIICLFTDLTRRKIYNFVLFPAVIMALGYYIFTDGLPGGFFSLQGLSLGLGLLLIPYFMGGIGAGDVKLLATIGALKGSSFLFTTFLAGATAGGILAIFYLIRNRRLLLTLKKLFLPLFISYGFFTNYKAKPEEDDKSITIPYGAAIAIGTLAAYFVR